MTIMIMEVILILLRVYNCLDSSVIGVKLKSNLKKTTISATVEKHNYFLESLDVSGLLHYIFVYPDML